METITRRSLTVMGLAATLAPAAFAATRYPRLPQPDPRLWHVGDRPAAEGRAPGPNGPVYYRRYGRAGRTPAIVLHGGPAGGETYMRPYAGLAADRPVVLYDQSGCGRSASPADLSRYTVDRYVAELEALRTHLRLPRVVLVGHSWGCFLAARYAAAHPDRVAAIVLAGGAARWRDFADAAQVWLRELGPDAAAIVARAEASGRTDDPAYQALTGRYYARHLCRLDPMPAFLAAAGEAIAANPVYRHLNGPSEFQFTGAFAALDVSPALRSLRVPVLVTCGEYDEAPPPVARRMAALVPGARLRVFPGLSHMAHIEDPATVVGATRAFLARVA